MITVDSCCPLQSINAAWETLHCKSILHHADELHPGSIPSFLAMNERLKPEPDLEAASCEGGAEHMLVIASQSNS